jgi:hypothetical protein
MLMADALVAILDRQNWAPMLNSRMLPADFDPLEEMGRHY